MMIDPGSNKVNSFLNMAIEECTGKENCNKGFSTLKLSQFVNMFQQLVAPSANIFLNSQTGEYLNRCQMHNVNVSCWVIV